MTISKEYTSIDDYISQANVANQNTPANADEIFDEAIMVLEQMKKISGAPNVVDINFGKADDISAAEYDELIEWLESLEKTRH